VKKFIYILLPFTLLANTPFSSVDKLHDHDNISINDLVPFFELNIDKDNITKNFDFSLEIGASYKGVGKVLYPIDSYNKINIKTKSYNFTNTNKLNPLVQIGFGYKF